MNNFKIETERLILRDIEFTDLNNFHKLCTNIKVTKYLDYIKTESLEETEKWIKEKIVWNNENPRISFNLSILLKDLEKYVGWIGIGESEDSKDIYDFGFAILPKFQEKGYASEALKTVIFYIFENTKIKKIIGDCDKNNIASRKVMEKVGLKYEKEENGKVYMSTSKNS